MDQTSFDRITRLLGGATSRRSGVTAALGAALGLGGLTRVADAKQTGAGKNKGKPGKEGPCGNGSRKANICTKDKDCCTGLCNTKAGKKNIDGKGRCRCVRNGSTCTANRNCCNGMTCANGVCGGGSGPKPTPTCATTPDVCASGCAFSTVQAAITAAADGATIVIGEGTYVEELAIGKNIVLEGCPTATIKDTGAGNRTVHLQPTFTAELRNLVIDGTGNLDSQTNGGGIRCGGALILSGTTTITNGVYPGGGGVIVETGASLTMNDEASIYRCGTYGNGSGGGVLLMSESSLLTMNDASSIELCISKEAAGGGVMAQFGLITMTGSSAISGNSSPNVVNYGGGGVYLYAAGLMMSGNSTITLNSTGYYGGGVYLTKVFSTASILTLSDSASITSNTASDGNSGGGVYSNSTDNIVTGGAAIANNTPDDCEGTQC
jgi:hypothetical protein